MFTFQWEKYSFKIGDNVFWGFYEPQSLSVLIHQVKSTSSTGKKEEDVQQSLRAVGRAAVLLCVSCLTAGGAKLLPLSISFCRCSTTTCVRG